MARCRYGRDSFELTHADRVLFPDCGLTKGDLLAYYEGIADAMLPHLRDRPLTQQRFPRGIDADGFYQKEATDSLPAWIERAAVDTGHGPQRQILCQKRATLAYLAQVDCITPHVWLSRVDRPRRPDLLVFDLDPDDGRFEAARWAGLRCRELVESLGLRCYVKLTGSRGVHVAIPLLRRQDCDEVLAFAHGIARLLAERHPGRLTVEPRIAKRRGRVYLDVARNGYAQTVAAPYAVRARPGAPVAVPITWEELERRDLGSRSFDTRSVFDLLAARHDPWGQMRRQARSLAAARRRLDELVSG
jgi:bifunctional non-homologous end joining protein LigD